MAKLAYDHSINGIKSNFYSSTCFVTWVLCVQFSRRDLIVAPTRRRDNDDEESKDKMEALDKSLKALKLRPFCQVIALRGAC